MHRIHSTAGVAVLAMLTTAGSASAAQIYALNSANQIASFDSESPGTVSAPVNLSQSGFVDIDFSPANGKLYGITAAGVVYTINPATGAAVLAASPNPSTAFNGIVINRMDFNPAADRMRIFGTGATQNFRMVPDATAITAPQTGSPGDVTADGNFTGVAGAVLVGSAYTNNFDGVPAANTTLYSIDTNADQLIIHSVGPAFNTIAAVGPLNFAVGSNVGFDIAQNGVSYLSDGNAFYSVNLATGGLTSKGTIGAGAGSVTSLAATAVPEPTVAGLALFAAAGLLARRRVARGV
ncbi:DUF4394 domain-containing protein [Humisphaera borealis]|uniref:DUF4394 domain-containing protein n=1 Tax=Humisphaera borealis TaxID=2807512 RepID=A0A7M2X0Z8_9BACT|nr:DUF4394 domain-containing protein [Humisphaera borealis]QOV90410.1 DUF4394 domain-containing protein [Humisphaera borealis]